MRARHEEELEEKEGVLDVARGLLRDARYDSKVAHEDKRRRIKKEENDVEGVAHVDKRQKIKKEEDVDHVEQAEGQGGDAADGRDREVQAEESVRENLLALSYAMFDTLYGTRSFQPKAFCLFLLKKGENALAEQIALAAIEKSYGMGTHVSFVLEELVPQSDAPEDLVRSVQDLLSDVKEQSGKDALIEWFLQHDKTDEAFATALLIREENERLKRALPLTTTAARQQQLKESCTEYLRTEVIGMFQDDDWPRFMQSIPLPPREGYGWWHPDDEWYLEFAAKSMTAPNNAKIAMGFVERIFRKNTHSLEDMLINFPTTNLPKSGVTVLVAGRDEACEKTMKNLSNLDTALVRNEDVRSALRQLNVDPMVEIATHFRNLLDLPPACDCTTRHNTSMAAFRCTKCRDNHCNLALQLGIVLAIRRHPLTAQSEPFQAIGLPYLPSAAVAALVEMHFHSEAVVALLGANIDEWQLYCKKH
jgi:hypothetical protein